MSLLQHNLLSLLDGLRRVRHKTMGSGCCVLSLPFAPWRWKAALDERQRFLRTLLSQYASVGIGTESDTTDHITWRLCFDDRQAIADQLPETGEWALLFFGQRVDASINLPERFVGIKCEDGRNVAQQTGADLLVVSLPDDREWLLFEGSKS